MGFDDGDDLLLDVLKRLEKKEGRNDHECNIYRQPRPDEAAC